MSNFSSPSDRENKVTPRSDDDENDLQSPPNNNKNKNNKNATAKNSTDAQQKPSVSSSSVLDELLVDGRVPQCWVSRSNRSTINNQQESQQQNVYDATAQNVFALWRRSCRRQEMMEDDNSSDTTRSSGSNSEEEEEEVFVDEVNAFDLCFGVVNILDAFSFPPKTRTRFLTGVLHEAIRAHRPLLALLLALCGADPSMRVPGSFGVASTTAAATELFDDDDDDDADDDSCQCAFDLIDAAAVSTHSFLSRWNRRFFSYHQRQQQQRQFFANNNNNNNNNNNERSIGGGGGGRFKKHLHLHRLRIGLFLTILRRDLMILAEKSNSKHNKNNNQQKTFAAAAQSASDMVLFRCMSQQIQDLLLDPRAASSSPSSSCDRLVSEDAKSFWAPLVKVLRIQSAAAVQISPIKKKKKQKKEEDDDDDDDDDDTKPNVTATTTTTGAQQAFFDELERVIVETKLLVGDFPKYYNFVWSERSQNSRRAGKGTATGAPAAGPGLSSSARAARGGGGGRGSRLRHFIIDDGGGSSVATDGFSNSSVSMMMMEDDPLLALGQQQQQNGNFSTRHNGRMSPLLGGGAGGGTVASAGAGGGAGIPLFVNDTINLLDGDDYFNDGASADVFFSDDDDTDAMLSRRYSSLFSDEIRHQHQQQEQKDGEEEAVGGGGEEDKHKNNRIFSHFSALAHDDDELLDLVAELFVRCDANAFTSPHVQTWWIVDGCYRLSATGGGESQSPPPPFPARSSDKQKTTTATSNSFPSSSLPSSSSSSSLVDPSKLLVCFTKPPDAEDAAGFFVVDFHNAECRLRPHFRPRAHLLRRAPVAAFGATDDDDEDDVDDDDAEAGEEQPFKHCELDPELVLSVQVTELISESLAVVAIDMAVPPEEILEGDDVDFFISSLLLQRQEKNTSDSFPPPLPDVTSAASSRRESTVSTPAVVPPSASAGSASPSPGERTKPHQNSRSGANFSFSSSVHHLVIDTSFIEVRSSFSSSSASSYVQQQHPENANTIHWVSLRHAIRGSKKNFSVMHSAGDSAMMRHQKVLMTMVTVGDHSVATVSSNNNININTAATAAAAAAATVPSHHVAQQRIKVGFVSRSMTGSLVPATKEAKRCLAVRWLLRIGCIPVAVRSLSTGNSIAPVARALEQQLQCDLPRIQLPASFFSASSRLCLGAIKKKKKNDSINKNKIKVTLGVPFSVAVVWDAVVSFGQRSRLFKMISDLAVVSSVAKPASQVVEDVCEVFFSAAVPTTAKGTTTSSATPAVAAAVHHQFQHHDRCHPASSSVAFSSEPPLFASASSSSNKTNPWNAAVLALFCVACRSGPMSSAPFLEAMNNMLDDKSNTAAEGAIDEGAVAASASSREFLSFFFFSRKVRLLFTVLPGSLTPLTAAARGLRGDVLCELIEFKHRFLEKQQRQKRKREAGGIASSSSFSTAPPALKFDVARVLHEGFRSIVAATSSQHAFGLLDVSDTKNLSAAHRQFFDEYQKQQQQQRLQLEEWLIKCIEMRNLIRNAFLGGVNSVGGGDDGDDDDKSGENNYSKKKGGGESNKRTTKQPTATTTVSSPLVLPSTSSSSPNKPRLHHHLSSSAIVGRGGAGSYIFPSTALFNIFPLVFSDLPSPAELSVILKYRDELRLMGDWTVDLCKALHKCGQFLQFQSRTVTSASTAASSSSVSPRRDNNNNNTKINNATTKDKRGTAMSNSTLARSAAVTTMATSTSTNNVQQHLEQLLKLIIDDPGTDIKYLLQKRALPHIPSDCKMVGEILLLMGSDPSLATVRRIGNQLHLPPVRSTAVARYNALHFPFHFLISCASHLFVDYDDFRVSGQRLWDDIDEYNLNGYRLGDLLRFPGCGVFSFDILTLSGTGVLHPGSGDESFSIRRTCALPPRAPSLPPAASSSPHSSSNRNNNNNSNSNSNKAGSGGVRKTSTTGKYQLSVIENNEEVLLNLSSWSIVKRNHWPVYLSGARYFAYAYPAAAAAQKRQARQPVRRHQQEQEEESQQHQSSSSSGGTNTKKPTTTTTSTTSSSTTKTKTQQKSEMKRYAMLPFSETGGFVFVDETKQVVLEVAVTRKQGTDLTFEGPYLLEEHLEPDVLPGEELLNPPELDASSEEDDDDDERNENNNTAVIEPFPSPVGEENEQEGYNNNVIEMEEVDGGADTTTATKTMAAAGDGGGWSSDFPFWMEDIRKFPHVNFRRFCWFGDSVGGGFFALEVITDFPVGRNARKITNNTTGKIFWAHYVCFTLALGHATDMSSKQEFDAVSINLVQTLHKSAGSSPSRASVFLRAPGNDHSAFPLLGFLGLGDSIPMELAIRFHDENVLQAMVAHPRCHTLWQEESPAFSDDGYEYAPTNKALVEAIALLGVVRDDYRQIAHTALVGKSFSCGLRRCTKFSPSLVLVQQEQQRPTAAASSSSSSSSSSSASSVQSRFFLSSSSSSSQQQTTTTISLQLDGIPLPIESFDEQTPATDAAYFSFILPTGSSSSSSSILRYRSLNPATDQLEWREDCPFRYGGFAFFDARFTLLSCDALVPTNTTTGNSGSSSSSSALFETSGNAIQISEAEPLDPGDLRELEEFASQGGLTWSPISTFPFFSRTRSEMSRKVAGSSSSSSSQQQQQQQTQKGVGAATKVVKNNNTNNNASSSTSSPSSPFHSPSSADAGGAAAPAAASVNNVSTSSWSFRAKRWAWLAPDRVSFAEPAGAFVLADQAGRMSVHSVMLDVRMWSPRFLKSKALGTLPPPLVPCRLRIVSLLTSCCVSDDVDRFGLYSDEGELDLSALTLLFCYGASDVIISVLQKVVQLVTERSNQSVSWWVQTCPVNRVVVVSPTFPYSDAAIWVEDRGLTITHWCALIGSEKLFDHLLQVAGAGAGSAASAKRTSVLRRTPLHYAVYSGNTVIVKKLLERFGGHHSINAREGAKTVVSCYSPSSSSSSAQQQQQQQQQNAASSSSSSSRRGLTPLHLACWFGNSDSIQVLLEEGASPSLIADYPGRAPSSSSSSSSTSTALTSTTTAATTATTSNHDTQQQENNKNNLDEWLLWLSSRKSQKVKTKSVSAYDIALAKHAVQCELLGEGWYVHHADRLQPLLDADESIRSMLYNVAWWRILKDSALFCFLMLLFLFLWSTTVAPGWTSNVELFPLTAINDNLAVPSEGSDLSVRFGNFVDTVGVGALLRKHEMMETQGFYPVEASMFVGWTCINSVPKTQDHGDDGSRGCISSNNNPIIFSNNNNDASSSSHGAFLESAYPSLIPNPDHPAQQQHLRLTRFVPTASVLSASSYLSETDSKYGLSSMDWAKLQLVQTNATSTMTTQNTSSSSSPLHHGASLSKFWTDWYANATRSIRRGSQGSQAFVAAVGFTLYHARSQRLFPVFGVFETLVSGHQTAALKTLPVPILPFTEDTNEYTYRVLVVILCGFVFVVGFATICWVSYRHGKRAWRTWTTTTTATSPSAKTTKDNSNNSSNISAPAAGGAKFTYLDEQDTTQVDTTNVLHPSHSAPMFRGSTRFSRIFFGWLQQVLVPLAISVMLLIGLVTADTAQTAASRYSQTQFSNIVAMERAENFSFVTAVSSSSSSAAAALDKELLFSAAGFAVSSSSFAGGVVTPFSTPTSASGREEVSATPVDLFSLSETLMTIRRLCGVGVFFSILGVLFSFCYLPKVGELLAFLRLFGTQAVQLACFALLLIGAAVGSFFFLAYGIGWPGARSFRFSFMAGFSSLIDGLSVEETTPTSDIFVFHLLVLFFGIFVFHILTIALWVVIWNAYDSDESRRFWWRDIQREYLSSALGVDEGEIDVILLSQLRGSRKASRSGGGGDTDDYERTTVELLHQWNQVDNRGRRSMD